MARAGKTAQEFIQSSFSPIVAVLCSPKVENIVSKNNLTFPELLQPFSTLDWEGKNVFTIYLHTSDFVMGGRGLVWIVSDN